MPGAPALARVRRYGGNWLAHLRRRWGERGRPRTGRSAFVTFGGRRPTRYDVALLQFLERAGYDVVLEHARSTMTAAGDYAELLLQVPGLRIALARPRAASLLVDLSDAPGAPEASGAGRRGRWGRRVIVTLDALSEEARRPEAHHVPFPMHPLLYALGADEDVPRLRASRRVARLLFAGNQSATAYTAESIARFGLVGRHALLERVRAALGPDEVEEVGDAATLVAGGDGYRRRLLLVDSATCWIPRERWLATLAAADFFLAPPGVVMPLCHNVVEAMAVGTIPVTEYGAFFPVPLEHGRTCIAFRGEHDLVAKLREVLALDAATIAAMRREVCRYYDEHLAPASLGRRLEAAPGDDVTLHMLAEHLTVRRLAPAPPG